MKKKNNNILVLIFFGVFLLFFFLVVSPFSINSMIAKNRANMESLIKEMETNPGEIFYVKDYQRNEIIYDKDLELIEFIKNTPLKERPKGVNNTDNTCFVLGNPFSNENRIYLIIYKYQLIEITSYYDGDYGHAEYGVSEEDGKRIVEKAKEVIQKEEIKLKEEKENYQKMISWDNFLNYDSTKYNYSLDANLGEYKYIDDERSVLDLLKNISHEAIDKSVYKPILRYGTNDDNKIDFLLDKEYEKITFRLEKKNRYNNTLFFNASYKISKEDGHKIYEVLKRGI